MARLRKLTGDKIKTENQKATLGERLRNAREKEGISLEEVHEATKIHPRVLEAIEEDRLENILGQTYVKAFIKNYAHYLGLDAGSLVQEYTSKHIPEPLSKPVLEPKLFSQKERKNFTRVVIITAAFLIWFLILGFATRKFIHYYKAVVENRNIVMAKKAMLKEETEKKDLKETKRLIPIPKRNTITLTLAVSKNSWMKVILDGETTFHKTLSKNSKETWKAKNEIRLAEIGKPEALKLNVNGKNIDLSGKRLGRNILITHKGVDLGPR